MIRVCLATDSRVPSGMGVHMLTLADALDDCEVVMLARPETDLFAAASDRYRVRALTDDTAALVRWLRVAGIDLVHVHAGIGWEGHAIVAAAADAGVPVVRSEHLPFLISEPEQIAQYRAQSGKVAEIIAVSDSVAQSFANSGAAMSPITVVENGIATPAESRISAARFERIDARPMLINVGRLAAQKNQALLVDMAAELARRGRPVDLVLVGDGPERAGLLDHIRSAGMAGHVRLLGERADVLALMRVADLAVHASAFEGLPLVLLEAMAAGLPIVAVDAPGVREALTGDTALLVPTPSSAALADAVESALQEEAATADRATAARARQQNYFTAARMADATRAIYHRHARKASPMNTLRIGFVGAGGIAHRHAGVLETMDDVVITAVADADAGRAAKFAQRQGAATFTDVEDMLAAGVVDAVFVCVPPFAHGAVEQAIIAAGLPFFVEKPVALSLELAEGIAAAVEERGLVTAVGYHWRWLDTLDAVRSAMGSRQPRLVSGYWLDSTPPVDWWWQQDRSGGQMTEQATHVIDLARYLCGDVSQVFGLAEHTDRAAFPGLDVATASTASARFASGAIGNFAATCLLGWNHRVGLHLFGDGFAIEITDHDAMIDVGAGRPVIPNGSDPVWHQDRAFVDAALGRENRIRCSYADALASLRVVDAIARSVASGAAVSLDAAAYPAHTPAVQASMVAA